MNNKNIYFPYYSGNIKFTKVQGYVSLDKFIEKQKRPSQRMDYLFNLINEAELNNDKKAKRRLKHQLYSFTPSVIIDKGVKRCYDNIKKYTGLMQLDFDKIETKEIAEELKEYLFSETNMIVCVYVSPSGLGVKSLLKIETPKTKDEYKAIHKAVTNKFKAISYFDEATKNAMLPLFLSRDKNILSRDFNDCNTWREKDYSKPNYVNLNEIKPKNYSSSNYYERITIEIFSKKIRSIVSDGHTQLRSACLILGSRCSAGYLDINEAIVLAKNEVIQNSYLQKDLNNYLSTTNWAIKQGYKSPKYY